jgi:hypothetical protein
MRARPWSLLQVSYSDLTGSLHRGLVSYRASAPEQSTREQDNTSDGQKPTHKVDTLQYQGFRKAERVDSGRREITKHDDNESQAGPRRGQQANVPPGRIRRDQLGPEHRRDEWKGRHQHDDNIEASL